MAFLEDPKSESWFLKKRRRGTGFYGRSRLCGASDFFNNIGPFRSFNDQYSHGRLWHRVLVSTRPLRDGPPERLYSVESLSGNCMSVMMFSPFVSS
jgi:hypothetical protein